MCKQIETRKFLPKNDISYTKNRNFWRFSTIFNSQTVYYTNVTNTERNYGTVSTRKKNDRYHLNFGLAHVTIWSGQISHVTLCSFRRQKNFASKWMLRKNFPPWEINWKGYYRNHWTVTILSNWFPTVESSSVSIHFEAKFFCRRKNGHVSKPKIQMQSIVFFRVLTVQWFR